MVETDDAFDLALLLVRPSFLTFPGFLDRFCRVSQKEDRWRSSTESVSPWLLGMR